MTRLLRFKGLVLALLMTLCLTACSGGGGEPETTTKKPAGQKEKPVEAISLVYDQIEDDSDTLDAYTQHIFLGSRELEYEYAALSDSLSKLNAANDEQSNMETEKLQKDAEDYKAKYGIEFFPGEVYSRRQFIPRRADTTVVSLLMLCEYYDGTSDMRSEYLSLNYDTKTGKQLYLGDVFPTFEKILPAISESLKKSYPKADFLEENLTKAIRALYEADAIEFTIDYEGITFYFNSGVLADESDGVLTASFKYNSFRDNINKKFTEVPKVYSYCFTDVVPNYRSVAVDVDSDNLLGGYKSMELEFDETETKLPDFACQAYRAYVVHMDKGDEYIYVDTKTETGYGDLYVYSLGAKNLYELKHIKNSSIFATGLGDSAPCYTDLFTNPKKFRLGTRCDMLATSVAKNDYKVGSDGLPVLRNPEAWYTIDSMHQYTLRSDIRDNEGVLIKSGSSFIFVYTDLSDTVVFVTEEGLEHTFNLSKINVNRTVDGIEYTE